jgi:hypothetical protein
MDDSPGGYGPGQLWLSRPAPRAGVPEDQEAGEDQAAGRVRRGAAVPTEAEIASARFLRACSEVLGGFRPLRHLAVLISADYFGEASERLLRPRRQQTLGPSGPTPPVSGRFAAGSGAAGATPGIGATGAPMPPAVRPVPPQTPVSGPVPVRRPRQIRTATGPADAVQVRHQRTSEPADGVAEVGAVLARGGEIWAMAVRLERGPSGWLCTFLQVL